jgi:hypothetical protein
MVLNSPGDKQHIFAPSLVVVQRVLDVLPSYFKTQPSISKIGIDIGSVAESRNVSRPTAVVINPLEAGRDTI